MHYTNNDNNNNDGDRRKENCVQEYLLVDKSNSMFAKMGDCFKSIPNMRNDEEMGAIHTQIACLDKYISGSGGGFSFLRDDISARASTGNSTLDVSV